jgi:hypothetical protein
MELGVQIVDQEGWYIQTRIEPQVIEAAKPDTCVFYIGRNYNNIKWLLGQFESILLRRPYRRYCHAF